MECIKNDIHNIIKNVKTAEKNETIKMSKEEEIDYYDNIIEIIEERFTDNYDTSNIDKGKDEVIETEKMTITFTTTQNQRNNINYNMSSIELGTCETLLRKDYNISINEALYMKKIDIAQEGMKTQKVEYDVYCKLSGENLIKLNLTACKNSRISIFVPIKITENLELQGKELQAFIDKLNINSGYYNDICYTTTSEEGTDITLKDRKINYINRDMIVCQEDCDFAKLEPQTLLVECSCEVKESSSSIADMSINIDKLLENFKNIKNFANLNFLVCHKKLFNKNGIKNNIGSYLILVIILFHILTIIIFYLKQYLQIKVKIKDISFGINEYQLIEENATKKKTKLNKKKLNNNNIIKNDSDKNEIIAPKIIKKIFIIKRKKSRRVSKRQIISTIKK